MLSVEVGVLREKKHGREGRVARVVHIDTLIPYPKFLLAGREIAVEAVRIMFA